MNKKTVFITGASRGIGRAIALRFAAAGYDLAICCLNNTAMLDALKSEVCSQYGVDCLTFTGDTGDYHTMMDMLEQTFSRYGKIDVLVNCAGVGILENLEESTRKVWDLTIGVNLTAGVHLALAAGKEMKKTGGGSIINIASQAGIVALEGHLSYGTAKAAFIQATKQIALEWGQYGIRANCISPEVILTPMGEMNWNNEKGEEFKRRIPSRRFGYPQEVAACAVFLASDASSLCNGSNLVIDGGYTIQ